MSERIVLHGILGQSAHRDVILGFAPADLLHRISFADVLDQDSRRGYQRRFSPAHSLDFRRYIQQPHSSTIPLTFNLRPGQNESWFIKGKRAPYADLHIDSGGEKVLSQVDCQHRLGYLGDCNLVLPYMCFLGLNEKEEMEVFNVINSKAKGLSNSLLDFHDATLASDLAGERPELFIALHLNNDLGSPWYRQLDLGGSSTSGLMRRASLRTLQKATKKFLSQTRILRNCSVQTAAQLLLDFWSAIAILAREAWDAPRHHLITKGVGVYALMGVAADLYLELPFGQICDKKYLVTKLSEFIGEIDWKTDGLFKGLGGESGVKSALSLIRDIRTRSMLKVISGGK